MLSLAKELREIVGLNERKVRVDAASFSRSYQLCDLSKCQGMCCYDGVFLEAPEKQAIDKIVSEEGGRLEEWRIDLEAGATTLEQKSDGRRQAKTRTRPFDYEDRALVPDHFGATACVFRCPDGRCSLQRISAERGHHPWYFKPMGCWMHPLELSLDGQSTLSVSSFGRSPFSASTQCGKVCGEGRSGFDVFKGELEALSVVLGQDLLGENDSLS